MFCILLYEKFYLLQAAFSSRFVDINFTCAQTRRVFMKDIIALGILLLNCSLKSFKISEYVLH
jgi:hypothetical protein